MSRFIRLSLLAAATAALVACGGGAKLGGGKEGAAKALFEATQPASKGGQTGGQALVQRLVSAAQSNTGGEFSVNCANGGSVNLKLDFTSIFGENAEEGKIKYDLEYKECNEDGANEFNGKMAMEFKFGFDQTSAAIELSGEIDDFLDADVTQMISVAAPSQTSGSVTIKLTGTIKTSESTYTYDGTPITITVEGEIPAADDGKS